MKPLESNHWKPTLYDRAASFVPALAADLVPLLAPKPGERVLDLGCGTGTLSVEVARAAGMVTALDASAEMIEAARERHGELCSFVIGDAQELGYDACFDAVFSNAALHWMPRADAVARGVARALVPGGRFVAEFGGAGCIQRVLRAGSALLAAFGEDDHWLRCWYFPTLAEYAGVLERAGLEPRYMHCFERPTPMPGEAGLRTWLELFQAPLLAHLGPRADAFARELADRCAPELYRDGSWYLDYVRLRVVALKPTC